MTARLSINRREFGNGKGVDVMGHPLNVLGWLAGKTCGGRGAAG